MKHRHIIALTLLLTLLLPSLTLQAQVPAEVRDVMHKCEAAMSSPKGTEIDMDMKASWAFVTLMNIHFVTGEKNGKSKTTMTMSILGNDVTIESGFDGEQEWMASDDTVTITKTTTKHNKKAKLKLKKDHYAIDFSDPVDKNNEAKTVSVKVSKKDYRLQEMKMTMKGAKATMTVNKIRFGLPDSYFKLDLSKYPKAKIIRK